MRGYVVGVTKWKRTNRSRTVTVKFKIILSSSLAETKEDS